MFTMGLMGSSSTRSNPTTSPQGCTYLNFFATFSLMETWIMMGKISILCRTQTLSSFSMSRRAWVFWGVGREVSLSLRVHEVGAHTQGKHGEKHTGRTEVCKGDGERIWGCPFVLERVCCTVLKPNSFTSDLEIRGHWDYGRLCVSSNPRVGGSISLFGVRRRWGHCVSWLTAVLNCFVSTENVIIPYRFSYICLNLKTWSVISILFIHLTNVY